MTQASLFDYQPKPTPRYPYHAGFKTGGASREAAETVEKKGKKQIWSERCKARFDMRPDWTAEEGIDFYTTALKLDRLTVDKNLRPRFSELVGQDYLRKKDTRRRSRAHLTGELIGGEIEVHPYERVQS